MWPGRRLSKVTTPHLAEGVSGVILGDETFRQCARFAEWRAVFQIDGQAPTWQAMRANAHALTRYASLCHEAVFARLRQAGRLVAAAAPLGLDDFMRLEPAGFLAGRVFSA
jgi:Fructose-bisphosphate aldolase class-I